MNRILESPYCNEEMSDISYRLYMDLSACPQYISDLHNENIQHTLATRKVLSQVRVNCLEWQNTI